MLRSGANWKRLDTGNAMAAILALAVAVAKFRGATDSRDSVLSLQATQKTPGKPISEEICR